MQDAHTCLVDTVGATQRSDFRCADGSLLTAAPGEPGHVFVTLDDFDGNYTDSVHFAGDGQWRVWVYEQPN